MLENITERLNLDNIVEDLGLDKIVEDLGLDKLGQRVQDAQKPVRDLVSVGSSAFLKQVDQQAALVSGLAKEGVELTDNLINETDARKAFEYQRDFLFMVTGTLVASASNSFDILVSSVSDAAEIVGDSFSFAK